MSRSTWIIAACGLGLSAAVLAAEKPAAPAPNGLTLPADYKDWRVIAPSYRIDKKHVRVILGNDVAIAAARSGKINPWPEGAVLAKVVWKEKPDAAWPTALGAGDFSHAEIMVRDSKKHAATGGWGYARWTGLDLKPYGKDANFAQECVACHTPVKGQDWVFTRPARFP